jgi:hypothetical protein
MRLPYKKSFQSLKIVRMAIESCHATKGDLVRIYFQLSEPPPLGWGYIFTTVWRSMVYPMKRQTGVERDAIWIDCVPNEIATCHLKQLEYAVAQTSAIYCKEAQEQARDELSRAEQHARIRLKLEELNQTFYPATAPGLKGGSIIAKWLRSIFPGRKQKPTLPVRPAATLEPQDDMREYHHGRFDGAAIGQNGRSLSLDYFDHDPGGTRFCFRYIISVSAPPRLVSGYTHEDSRLDYEIPFERIPRHVFSEARYWLTSHIEAHQDKPITKSLNELLAYLKEHENAP